MNENVGDMPIEIFGDIISEYLDIDFSWEYMALVYNSHGTYYTVHQKMGSGFGIGYNTIFYHANGNAELHQPLGQGWCFNYGYEEGYGEGEFVDRWGNAYGIAFFGTRRE